MAQRLSAAPVPRRYRLSTNALKRKLGEVNHPQFLLHRWPRSGLRQPAHGPRRQSIRRCLRRWVRWDGRRLPAEPLGANTWTYTILHQFTYDEGYVGFSTLYMDSQGNLCGVGDGGLFQAGIVWQLVPSGVSGYYLNVIYNFPGGSGGDGPFGAPVFSTDGKLYGNTYNGGIDDLGVVYQLTPHSNAQWTGDVLYRFQPGSDPYAVVAPRQCT